MFRSPSLHSWSPKTTTRGTEWESPIWHPGFQWDEAVPSWNVAEGSAWTIELRAVGPGQSDDWFPLGSWCSDTNRGVRTSWKGDAFRGGRVLTDTLRLFHPAEGVQARLIAHSGTTVADFRHFAVSLLDSRAQWTEAAPFPSAWGKSLAVPIRSQAEYPEGVQSWCSPAAVTMLLAWWQATMKPAFPLPEVPETARGVFDPGWPGTGNWAFNMVFVGQTPGLRAAVARLADVSDLERWIAAGFPVATSVSYSLLKERPAAEPGDGHLVVVRGFTAEGDVLIDDPGVRLSRVERTVKRATFRVAWRHSHQTAYLVWPANARLPDGGQGRW